MKLRLWTSSLHKTLAFGLVHLLIAVSVGWVITGSFVLAGTLALIEPAVNTAVHHVFDAWWRQRSTKPAEPSWRKSLLFGGLHLVVAVTVGWVLTGSWVMAGALALVEPAANTLAHYVFDRWWSRARPAPPMTSAA